MLERLRDSKRTAGGYVRHLKIGPFKDEDRFEFGISPMLEDTLRSIDNLKALTWNMNCPPLQAMLDKFHELHPSAHLHVVLRNRKFKSLSRSLLSSPQLHTLDAEIFRTIPEETGYSLSELSFVKNSLASGLQGLRLTSRGVHTKPQRAQFEGWESVKHDMFNLDFRPGDRTPALSELVLEHDELFLKEENCNLWARASSWEWLQRLDLHKGAPRQFFASLTGRATNLKYLRFYMNPPTRNRTWDLHPLDTGLLILARFIASTKSLHTLDFGMQCLDDLTRALRIVLQNLHSSLSSLTISYTQGFDTSGPIDFTPGILAWDLEHFMEVLELAPSLEHLDARFGKHTVVGNWKGEDRFADARTKWKTAEKKIKFKPKKKIQRSKKVQRLVW